MTMKRAVWKLVLLGSVRAISIKQAANASLSGYGKCGRPNGWCSTADNSHTYLHEDCNGDGLEDPVCYWQNLKWIRISGNCDLLNTGKSGNPTCEELRKKSEDVKKYLYATGTDHLV